VGKNVHMVNNLSEGALDMGVPMTLQIFRGFLAAILIIAACPANADDGLCRALPEISANPNLTVGHIPSGAAQVHFVKDGLMEPGCPNQTPACTDKAYLVPGDRVILSARADAFVCATYLNARGGVRTGWLPANAVAYDEAKPLALSDWLGKWSMVEAEITMKAGKTGALLIEGNATWGAQDPARVKRGGVNVGMIAGEVTPAGERLSFAMGDSATLPVDKGGEFDCKVWMRRLGPWLIVDDNGNCGGHNVTFRGIYTHKRA
jgi:hypothetical protein